MSNRSRNIAEAMIAEAEAAEKSPTLTSCEARLNIRETLELLERRHQVRPVPGLRAVKEPVTAGSCFKRVKKILDGREPLN